MIGFQNTKWSTLIADYKLTHLITHPTRATKVSSSTIDHLYTHHSENVLEIVSSNPIAFTVDTVNIVNDNNKVKTITYTCYKTFQEQHFMNDSSKYFHVLDNLNIIGEQHISLETILCTTIDRHAPIKTKRVKHVHTPTWLTDEIILALHKRDKLYKQGKLEEYKVLRTKINAMIKKSKKNVFNNAIQDGKNTKHLWNNIKSVSNNSDKKLCYT